MIKKLEKESDEIIGLKSQTYGLKNEIKFLKEELDEIKSELYSVVIFTQFSVRRSIAKITLRQVAEKTGVCISTISRFENAKDISFSSYLKLRDFYIEFLHEYKH